MENSHSPAKQTGIPIVDFTSWTSSGNAEDRQKTAEELVDACRRVGFVYIVNHGVSPEFLQEAFSWTKKLFSLTDEEKLQAPHPDSFQVHRGYSWPGLEKVSQVMSADDDSDIASKLRQVTDCKVIIPGLKL